MPSPTLLICFVLLIFWVFSFFPALSCNHDCVPQSSKECLPSAGRHLGCIRLEASTPVGGTLLSIRVSRNSQLLRRTMLEALEASLPR